MEDDAVLGRDSFQSAEFLQKYPLPDGYPNGAALFSCPPALKGRFWPADSWAWKFVDMFPPSYNPPENTQWQDLFVKEQLCVKGTIKKNLPVRPRTFKMLINRVFGQSATGGKAKFQRWLSNMVLPKRQASEGGMSRWDAATCFVVWFFGGTIPYDAIAKHISSW